MFSMYSSYVGLLLPAELARGYDLHIGRDILSCTIVKSYQQSSSRAVRSWCWRRTGAVGLSVDNSYQFIHARSSVTTCATGMSKPLFTLFKTFYFDFRLCLVPDETRTTHTHKCSLGQRFHVTRESAFDRPVSASLTFIDEGREALIEAHDNTNDSTVSGDGTIGTLSTLRTVQTGLHCPTLDTNRNTHNPKKSPT